MTSTTAPQHLTALAKANDIRLKRARLKRSIGGGSVAPSEVLNPDRKLPYEAASMTVAELLTAQNRWGASRMRRFLVPLDIRENRRLCDLTRRQRMVLARALSGRSLPEQESIAA